MKVRLAYGMTGLEVNLPENVQVTVLEPRHVAGLADPRTVLRDALRHPIGTRPLRDLAQAYDRVGIVVSDMTRPVPNHLIVSALLAELGHVRPEQITLFIATGTHRPTTFAELNAMLGAEIVAGYRIVQSDALDRSKYTCVGTSSQGNDIWILSEFAQCDVRILTGLIEPHLFAGFSGGGKAVMPGLTATETILRNHKPMLIDHPCARYGITAGNPIWEEIREAAAMTKPSFLVNVALNREREITGVFAGEWQEAHDRGCSFVRDLALAPIPEPFDIVITSNAGYPLDLSLAQSVKGMSAAALAVKEGGSIIVAAECSDGLPDHGDHARLLRTAKDPRTLLEMLRHPGYLHMDMWGAQIQASICLRADVYFYSHNLSDDQIQAVWLKPCRSIEATLKMLLHKYGRRARVCVLPAGPCTIPR